MQVWLYQVQAVIMSRAVCETDASKHMVWEALLRLGFQTTLIKIYFDSSPKAQRLRR